MARAVATALAVLVATAMLPAAVAARSIAPPGNSEADQYFETLPEPAGPRSPDPERSTEDALRERSLAPRTVQALEQGGASAQALAGAVASTAPPRAAAGGASGAGEAPGGAAAAQGAGPVTEQGGMGVAFPLALAASLLAALAFLLGRRRGISG